MLGLLAAVLLAIAGVSLSYRFSSAAKLKTRLQEALSPLEELDSDIRQLQQNLRHETESLTNSHIQGIYAARLKSIPVDDLKKYATGMRLQALKDIGVRTVADLEGWSEYRVSQVHGVGPKSAYAIVHSVAEVIAATKAAPIPPPVPPFSEDSGRQLIQALYRERWFLTHVSDQANSFAMIVASHRSTRDVILATITFGSWLWKFGANSTIRESVKQGDALIQTLADHALRDRQEKLSEFLSECRRICSNRVPAESIIQDFNNERVFYEANLSKKFTLLSCATPENTVSRSEDVKLTAPSAIHVEFGRIVSGPAPQPSATGASKLETATTNPAQREYLFSVSLTSPAGIGAKEFTLPPAPRVSEKSDLRWLKKGEAIQIQGHTLPHGCIYTGKGISNEQHYALNPSLLARLGDLTPADAPGYYSSYASFSPERRWLYLNWLAEGAQSATDPSFGMLYFYGIERRIIDLLQEQSLDPTGEEREQLLHEVQRVAALFSSTTASVTQCCARLSDFVAACGLDRNPVPQLPSEWVKTWELPFIIRYGIGWFMKERKPIPADWALRWAYTEPTVYLRTPATRCPEEFEAAFRVVYQRKYGEGQILTPNKTKLKLTYQPGWPMQFGKDIRYEFSGIPDVAVLTGPQQSLKSLVEEATAEIDGYSRYIGRNPAKSGSLVACLNLPLSLWPVLAAMRWSQFLESFVDPVQPIALESLLRELDPAGDPNQTRIPEIAGNLGRAAVGIEPDILSGARRPKPAEMIVLFPLTSVPEPERTSPEFKRASLIVSLSACVALADGHASEDEAAAVEEMIAAWEHLHADLRTRLRAQYRLHVGNGISLANVKSRFANLTPDGRLQMALSLCSLAAADGHIAAAEVKLLEQIYRALEMDPQLLYSHLHLGQKATEAGEMRGVPRDLGQTAYKVDSARLEALRRETEQVSELLAGVFVEEETSTTLQPKAPSQSLVAEKAAEEVLLPGLDSKHQHFLAELLRKASWTREELHLMAQRLQIMLDGALERINDAAFEIFGEPVTEGEDPIFVQQNILEAAE